MNIATKTCLDGIFSCLEQSIIPLVEHKVKEDKQQMEAIEMYEKIFSNHFKALKNYESSNCHCEILVENWSESLKALDKLKKSKQRLLRSRKELGLDEISQLYNEILKEADLETERKKFPQWYEPQICETLSENAKITSGSSSKRSVTGSDKKAKLLDSCVDGLNFFSDDLVLVENVGGTIRQGYRSDWWFGKLIRKVMNPESQEVFEVRLTSDLMNRGRANCENRVKTVFVRADRLAFAKTSNISTYRIGQTVLVQDFEPLLDQSLQVVNQRDSSFHYTYARGIIAEVPCKENRGRFMVFLENEKVGYVDPRFRVVHLAVDHGDEMFRHIGPDFEEMVLAYLEMAGDSTLPARPQLCSIVNAHRGNEKWVPVKVNKVDSSMIHVKFDDGSLAKIFYASSEFHHVLFSKEYQEIIWCLGSVPQSNGNLSSEQIVSGGNKLSVSGVSNGQQTQYVGTSLPVSNGVPTDNNIRSAQLPPEHDVITDNAELVNPPHRCWNGCIPALTDPQSPPPTSLPGGYLSIPLGYGFQRVCSLVFDGEYYETKVYYKSPCGKILHNHADIVVFLRRIRNVNFLLHLDMFCFDSSVRINPEHISLFNFQAVAIDDIACGQEIKPIPVINEVDDLFDLHFLYCRRKKFSSGIQVHLPPEPAENPQGCKCVEFCNDKSQCVCCQLTITKVKSSLSAVGTENRKVALDDSKIGYESGLLLNRFITGVYECNSSCLCSVRCGNRSVQNGIRLKLLVSKTATKGWSLKTLEDIQKGTFIGSYSGMVYKEAEFYKLHLHEISAVKAKGHALCVQIPVVSSQSKPSAKHMTSQRGGHLKAKQKELSSSSKYSREAPGCSCEGVKINSDQWDSFMNRVEEMTVLSGRSKTHAKKGIKTSSSQNNQEEFRFVVDASKHGNVMRFLNHSCDPNCFLQPVFIADEESKFHESAFFASKNIKAGEELTYFYNFGEVGNNDDAIWCSCGSSNCRLRVI